MTEIENKLNFILEQLDPTYVNVRNIHKMVFELTEDMKILKNNIDAINNRLDSVEKKLK